MWDYPWFTFARCSQSHPIPTCCTVFALWHPVSLLWIWPSPHPTSNPYWSNKSRKFLLMQEEIWTTPPPRYMYLYAFGIILLPLYLHTLFLLKYFSGTCWRGQLNFCAVSVRIHSPKSNACFLVSHPRKELVGIDLFRQGNVNFNLLTAV